MSKKFLSGINVTGTATLNTVADAGSNTDKFLVLDASNNVSYRTAAELYIDLGIGSTAAAYTSTLKHEVKASQTIGKGQAVYVSSADGTNMIVSKASNVSEQYSSKTMGLLETSLVANGKGNVITEGLLSGLNTNGANAGDPVWLGVDGALIFGLANKPYAPAHLVFIGIVTRANANNGEIFVKVQNGFEMNELHNYQEGSVQNNQIIVYESSTSLYKPKTIPTILGYTPVPDSRTITINGTSYDLSANRSWTITTDASARSILRYVATASQTTFTISGGYTPGLTDVYRNGVKLDNSTDFTATNGTTIVLTNGASVNDVIEVYRYQTAFLANNALRTVTEFIATAGQTTFSVTYNSGLVDVFYNGSKLVSSEFTAGNGTTIVLNFPCNLNDSVAVHAYSYAVGAFTGQAQLNGTGLVRMSGTTVSYDNATYATQSYVTTAVANLVNSAPTTLDTLNELATALGNDANFATTITTSISTKQAQLNGTGFVKVSGTTVSYDNSTYLTTSVASSTYLPLSGGILTGALSGTSANFSSTIQSVGQAVYSPTLGYVSTSYQSYAGATTWYVGAGSSGVSIQPFVIGRNLNGNSADFSIASTGAATFSSSVTAAGIISSSTVRPSSNYAADLGTSSIRWSSLFAYEANFASSIQIGTTPATITAGLAIGIPNDYAIRWRNSGNTGNVGMYLSGGNQFVFDTSIYANGEITATSHATFGATNSTSNVKIYSNGAPLTIFGGTGYARGFMGLTWDINPDRGLIVGNELRFNTNAIAGTTIGSTALTLTSNQAASFSGSVNFNSQGNIVAKASSVYNGTQTVTIGPGSYNGVMQIMVGVYGNGQGSQARAMWVCGGYVGSGIGFTEITRVNGGSITISALTANAGSCTFTVSYSFPNAADISVTVIGTNANTSPAIISIS